MTSACSPVGGQGPDGLPISHSRPGRAVDRARLSRFSVEEPGAIQKIASLRLAGFVSPGVRSNV